MIEKQPKTDEKVQKLADSLEEQVRQRTAELERKNRELQKEAEKRKSLQKKILEVRVQHQRSLGEQVHDHLVQQLYAARMLVKSFHKKARRGAEISLEQIEQLSNCLEIAEKEAQSLARGLIPVEPEGADGLVAALERLVDRICELWKKTDCRVESDGVVINDDFATLNLYYIAREAVNNALRHGRPTQIIIRLRTGDRGEVVLEVEDNGRGIRERDLEEGRGLGIELMEHRAEIIDAQLEISPREEGGTLVRCILTSH